MGQIQELYAEYSRMRDGGMDAKQALNILRHHIETLPKSDREELANLVRARESGSVATEASSDSQMKKKSPIKPMMASAPPPPPAAPPEPPPQPTTQPEPGVSLGIKPLKRVAENKKSAPENVVWVTCPNCGKTNQKHEVFCYACGQILEPVKGVFDTRHFSEPPVAEPSDTGYFGPDSVLALRIRGSAEPYEVRPQKIDHEVIVGRSVEGSPMMPDVDLHDKKAADLGVSRFHLSVHYDAEQQAILVSDLGSANGTFINGQRLMTKEVRVLRHGDELRLGKLVLNVSFRHPTGPLQE